MGLFSSKTEYTVQSSSQVLTDMKTDLVKASVITSTVDNRPLAEDLLSNIQAGFGGRLRGYYGWGRTQYVNGLPSGKVEFMEPRPDLIANVLYREVGAPVRVDYAILDFTDPKFFSFEYLDATYGFEYESEQVLNPPASWGAGSQAVLFSGSKIIPSTDASTAAQLEIDLIWNGGSTSITVTPITPMHTSELYYYTSYFLLNDQGDAGTTRYYWIYREESEEYPELNQPERVPQANPYFPIIPIQLDNQVLTDDADYAKNIYVGLNKLGIKLNNLTDALDENPANDRDRVYVLISAHIQDDSQYVMDYLFRYFEYLKRDQRYDYADYLRWENGPYRSGSPPYKNVLSFREGYYDLKISWNYISQNTITGQLTHPDTGRVGVIGTMVRQNYTSGQYGKYDPSDGGPNPNYVSDGSLMVLRKQVTETTYEEIQISGLQYTNYIIKGESVSSDLSRSISEWSGDDPQIFCIPVNNNVINRMGLKNAHYVAQRCIRMQVNAWDKQKVKWYQSSFGKIFLTILVIVITVIYMVATGDYSTGEAFFTAAMNAIYAYAATEIAIAVVDVIGLEGTMLGDIIVAAAAVAAAYYGSGGFNTSGSEAGWLAAPTMTDPQLFLAATTATLEVGMKYQQRQLNENMLGMKREMEEKEELMNEWGEHIEELEDGSWEPSMANNVWTNAATIERPESIEMKTNRAIFTACNSYLNTFKETETFFQRVLQMPDTSMSKDFIKIRLG